MQTKTNRPTISQALPSAVLATLARLAASKRLLGSWNWSTEPSLAEGKRLRLNWKLDVGWERRAIEELRRMSDRELADIGLSRSDLTLEGLQTAGAKRAFRQEAVATEIATSTSKRGADQRGS